MLNLAVILIHQFEEYRFPGSEPWVLNEVLCETLWRTPKEDVPADRFPTNQLSCIWINLAAWVFYLLPALFPNQVWLGLAPILAGFPAQFIAHGIITNRRLRTFYNPGLGAVVLGHLPLAVWYLIEVYQQRIIHWWDWVLGLFLLGFFTGIKIGRAHV